MPSSGMWRRVDIVLTDVPPKRRFTQDLHGATPPEDGILHSHRREDLKSYIINYSRTHYIGLVGAKGCPVYNK
jgi:hypothetical protein